MTNKTAWEVFKRLPPLWRFMWLLTIAVTYAVILFFIWIAETDKPLTETAGFIGILTIVFFFGTTFRIGIESAPIIKEMRKEGWKI